jgi:hypothetical protein
VTQDTDTKMQADFPLNSGLEHAAPVPNTEELPLPECLDDHDCGPPPVAQRPPRNLLVRLLYTFVSRLHDLPDM